MSNVVLSTMWMQHRFDHVRPFAASAQALGFDAIELSHYVTPAMVEGLQPGEVRVASLHYPAPSIHHASGVKGDKLLASLCEDERRWAVAQGYRSIDFAKAMGARVVCLHLGWVEMDVHLCWALEQRYQVGQAGSSAYVALHEQVVRQRAERQPLHLAAARRSLSELADHAARAGVRLGLENRRYFFEMPTLAEMRTLLAEHDPDVVGFWYDTGHAQVLANLGFDSHEEWLAVCGERIVGVHFHDSIGVRDHLLPGMGEVHFAGIARCLPADAVRVCEFDWYFDDAELRAAWQDLKEAGCLESAFA